LRRELDRDRHLVLESGSDHMIAEAPLAPAGSLIVQHGRA
jgi:hypothetical protein